MAKRLSPNMRRLEKSSTNQKITKFIFQPVRTSSKVLSTREDMAKRLPPMEEAKYMKDCWKKNMMKAPSSKRTTV